MDQEDKKSVKLTEIPGKYKILIVEDEEVNLQYYEILLNKISENFELITAINGQEAVEICGKQPGIDLILMDLKMPVMNGFEATKQIKKLRPQLPVIALTAYTLPEDEIKAKSAGCEEVVSKPTSKESLILSLNRYLS
ncbi:MAG: response regulator [Bacteroidia bacterium]|nr:response regulator [Bacteroidia bacterium]